jgi:pyrroline-5-carboxylate reductase
MPSLPLKVALVGSGIMAEAMIAGMLRDQLFEPQSILAAGPRLERGVELAAKYGIQNFTNNSEAAALADVIILSVKPVRIEQVLRSIQPVVKPDAIVFSIVAGVPMKKIATSLHHALVARAMPNTPGQIGAGISVWTAVPDIPPDRLEILRQIMLSLGQEIFVEDEMYLDMATALSGTGPAYVFLFMEAMIDAGVHMGFPRRIAEQLVSQTLLGSVLYYQQKKAHPAALRNEVTSPGGTSAEALYYLDKAGFRTAISRAIWAAYERSQSLGKDKSSPLENSKPEEGSKEES